MIVWCIIMTDTTASTGRAYSLTPEQMLNELNRVKDEIAALGPAIDTLYIGQKETEQLMRSGLIVKSGPEAFSMADARVRGISIKTVPVPSLLMTNVEVDEMTKSLRGDHFEDDFKF